MQTIKNLTTELKMPAASIKGGGFTPKTEYYIGIGSDTINKIIKKPKSADYDTSGQEFDCYDKVEGNTNTIEKKIPKNQSKLIEEEIRKIDSFYKLTSFILKYEGKNNEKLNLQFFTEFVVKLKKDFKSLSNFSRLTSITKVFGIGFENKITDIQKLTFEKYLEHEILKPEYTIFSPEGELLNKAILKEDDEVNEGFGKIKEDIANELKDINLYEDFIEYVEDLPYTEDELMMFFDIILNKLEEFSSEIYFSELGILKLEEFFGADNLNNLTEKNSSLLFKLILELEQYKD